jgi:hypothetical protein
MNVNDLAYLIQIPIKKSYSYTLRLGLSDLLCIYMTKLLQSDLLRGVELFHSSDDFRQKSNMEGEIYLV